jgi:hypothetical protein
MRRVILGPFAAAIVAGVIAIGSTAAFAESDASQLPPNWHVHDGQTSLGPQHKGVGFFPAILAPWITDYSQDPAACPDATDKAFLPQGKQDNQPLRAGVCQSRGLIIHLRSVPQGESGPEGWSLAPGTETVGGVVYVTYYRVTER